MNRKTTDLRERSTDPTERPLLVGCHKHRIDADRRVRLPAFWAAGITQMWLIFPLHLFPPGKSEGRELRLIPTGGDSLNTKIRASFGCAALGSTFKALLEIMRDNARRLSLPLNLATAVRINPASGRFALTRAQIDWLGRRARTVVIAGVVTHARVCTPTVWSKWRRDVAVRIAEPNDPKRLQGSIRHRQPDPFPCSHSS